MTLSTPQWTALETLARGPIRQNGSGIAWQTLWSLEKRGLAWARYNLIISEPPVWNIKGAGVEALRKRSEATAKNGQ